MSKVIYLRFGWLITPRLVFLVPSVPTLVGFRFNGELGIWGNVVPPSLCCFISSTCLIDRVPTEPPPSRKRAECTALSLWQLGFLHLRLTKSKKARRKDSVIDHDRPFQKLSFIAYISFETLTSRKHQTLGPIVLQWLNMGLMVTGKSGRSYICARVFIIENHTLAFVFLKDCLSPNHSEQTFDISPHLLPNNNCFWSLWKA